MNCVLKHIVYEVRIRFDEVIKCLQDLEVLAFFLMVDVETVLVLVQFHLIDCLFEFTTLLIHHFFAFLDLLLLFLELLDLAVDLLLHHLEQVLMLNF